MKMKQMAERFSISESGVAGATGLRTTLYELIETVNEVIKPGEERWVTFIVHHMLFSGRSISS